MTTDKELTLFCILIAGIFIIPSLVFNKPIIALIGVIFDLLPLIFGWLKKAAITISFPVAFGVVIAFTYLFFIIWLFGPRILTMRILFGEFWFLTVIARLE
ncbi:MAG: hypothetical protein J7L03_04725 [Caldisericaceae bacterium]|nr:hypothetical protein [Caldisericaceae bacterium]